MFFFLCLEACRKSPRWKFAIEIAKIARFRCTQPVLHFPLAFIADRSCAWPAASFYHKFRLAMAKVQASPSMDEDPLTLLQLRHICQCLLHTDKALIYCSLRRADTQTPPHPLIATVGCPNPHLFWIDFRSFLVTFDRFRPILVQIGSSIGPLDQRTVAHCAWPCGGGGLWLEVRSQR